jgi:hypothetical protein
MPYSNHEPQSVLEKSSYKLYYNGSIITDQTIHSRGWTQLCLIKPSKKHTSSNSQHSQPSQRQHPEAPEVHRIERGAYKNIVPETAYTGCPRRKGPNFGRVFLRSNYSDITQNTYIRSSTVTEILAREKCGLLWCLRNVLCP